MSGEVKPIRRVVVVPATLDSVRRIKDLALKITLTTTKEISNQDFSDLDELFTQGATIGNNFFVPNGVQAPEVPLEDAPERGIKGYSERIYKAMYALHMTQGGKPEDFHTFRAAECEYILSWLRDRIDQAETEKRSRG